MKEKISFIATTIFNFVSISGLLIFLGKFSFSAGLRTFLSQTAALILSMLFTIDIWWARISHEIKIPITWRQRLIFLKIASISGIASTLVSWAIFNHKTVKTTNLLLVNWIVLAVIALIKYLYFSRKILKN